MNDEVTCKGSVNLIPRLFLIEEEPGNFGWGGGAIYFRYATIHVISIGNAPFWDIIMWFLEAHVCMQKQMQNNTPRKKQQNTSEESQDISCSWLRSRISKLKNQAI